MYDLFISYSSKDALAAEAAKHYLESKGVRCWKAPECVAPGQVWEEAITSAIDNTYGMLLIWSSHSQSSKQVTRELSLAAAGEKIIIPLRIEPITPSGTFAYYLTNTHWIDALSPSLEQDLDRVSSQVASMLPIIKRSEGGAACDSGDSAAINNRPEPEGSECNLSVGGATNASVDDCLNLFNNPPSGEPGIVKISNEYLCSSADEAQSDADEDLVFRGHESDSVEGSPGDYGWLWSWVFILVIVVGFLNLLGTFFRGFLFVFKKGLGY